MTSVNGGISVNHDLLYKKLQKIIITDDRRNKVKKFTKFQSNVAINDGDMTSSKFDVMSDNFEVITPVNRDDNVNSKVSQCIFPHRAYLMMVQMIGKIKQFKSKVRHFKQT